MGSHFKDPAGGHFPDVLLDLCCFEKGEAA